MVMEWPWLDDTNLTVAMHAAKRWAWKAVPIDNVHESTFAGGARSAFRQADHERKNARIQNCCFGLNSRIREPKARFCSSFKPS